MRAWRIALIAVIGSLILGGVIYFAVSHYGTYTYQWKTNLHSYKTYDLLGDSTLNGYIKANGEISVYILREEDFKKMKQGKPFSYYKAWKHVKKAEFEGIQIPGSDYILVVKNEENKMQWISVKLREKRSAQD
ncbi:hypothetical protein [Thermococcus sp.]